MVANMGYFFINKQKYYPQGHKTYIKNVKHKKKKVKKKIKPILFYAWIETLEIFGEISVIKVDQHDSPSIIDWRIYKWFFWKFSEI